MELMFQPLKKYADFEGRARRKEYWLFYLGILIAEVVVMMAVGGIASNNGGGPSGLAFAILGVFLLLLLVPSLAVSFRRLHDINRSAWWLLIALVPFLGGIVLFVFLVLDGTPGPNRFGPDPKGRGAEAVAAAFA